ncbi:MAG: relaxase/mobilization nuclease domain-containing protein [Lachnospiraceae bacterium]|nr:relaxase/mobilization nuclease domain-containing protein [Lachnospiraceae bacterium]
MAITKIIGAIHPPSSGSRHKVLRNTIEYILNPEKTENGRLIGSMGCFTDNALLQMLQTQHRYGQDKTNLGKSERLGYHFTISFSPEEIVPPETALQVMKEFSEEFLGKQYEAVYSVHTDTNHLHGHLCFNSVNFRTGRKFCYKDGDWAKIIQPITDRICQKYGLHTLEMDTGKSIAEYEKEEKERKRRRFFENKKRKEEKELKKRGYHKDEYEKYSWNDHLRLLLDDIVLHSSTMEDFFQQLKERGITYKTGESKVHGPYLGLRAPGMEINRKTYQLGKEYTLESLKKRIEMVNKPLPEYQIPEHMLLIVPVKYYAWTKSKTVLSKEMRRYYARLYQLGIRPRSARLSYQDVKRAREKAEQMQKELEFVISNRVADGTAARQLVENSKQELQNIELDLAAWRTKHTDYEQVVKKYYWYQKIKKQTEVVQEVSEEQKNKIAEARQAFEKYGFSEVALEKYLQERKEEKRAIMNRKKEAEKRMEAAEHIVQDMEELEKQEEKEMSEEEQNFWKSIPEEEQEEKIKAMEGRKIK